MIHNAQIINFQLLMFVFGDMANNPVPAAAQRDLGRRQAMTSW